ncbi:hypothetical protein HK102_005578 [Quaeritorhiza haematococci]|nr:hypothetical protein HK102_005578 [Quaeritorhiza haematococci]
MMVDAIQDESTLRSPSATATTMSGDHDEKQGKNNSSELTSTSDAHVTETVANAANGDDCMKSNAENSSLGVHEAEGNGTAPSAANGGSSKSSAQHSEAEGEAFAAEDAGPVEPTANTAPEATKQADETRDWDPAHPDVRSPVWENLWKHYRQLDAENEEVTKVECTHCGDESSSGDEVSENDNQVYAANGAKPVEVEKRKVKKARKISKKEIEEELRSVSQIVQSNPRWGQGATDASSTSVSFKAEVEEELRSLSEIMQNKTRWAESAQESTVEQSASTGPTSPSSKAAAESASTTVAELVAAAEKTASRETIHDASDTARRGIKRHVEDDTTEMNGNGPASVEGVAAEPKSEAASQVKRRKKQHHLEVEKDDKEQKRGWWWSGGIAGVSASSKKDITTAFATSSAARVDEMDADAGVEGMDRHGRSKSPEMDVEVIPINAVKRVLTSFEAPPASASTSTQLPKKRAATPSSPSMVTPQKKRKISTMSSSSVVPPSPSLSIRSSSPLPSPSPSTDAPTTPLPFRTTPLTPPKTNEKKKRKVSSTSSSPTTAVVTVRTGSSKRGKRSRRSSNASTISVTSVSGKDPFSFEFSQPLANGDEHDVQEPHPEIKDVAPATAGSVSAISAEQQPEAPQPPSSTSARGSSLLGLDVERWKRKILGMVEAVEDVRRKVWEMKEELGF